MKPVRVQRKRTKGWRMPENTVYVGRGSKWGNPYRVGDINSYATSQECPDGTPMDRGDVVDLYESQVGMADIFTDGRASAAVRDELADKNLACWCPLDQPCHADMLLEIANPQTTEPLPKGDQ